MHQKQIKNMSPKTKQGLSWFLWLVAEYWCWPCSQIYQVTKFSQANRATSFSWTVSVVLNVRGWWESVFKRQSNLHILSKCKPCFCLIRHPVKQLWWEGCSHTPALLRWLASGFGNLLSTLVRFATNRALWRVYYFVHLIIRPWVKITCEILS